MSINLDDALNTARAAHESGDRDAATQGYLAIIQHDARHAEAWRLLGITYCEVGQYEKAIDALFRAIDLVNSNSSSAGSSSVNETVTANPSAIVGYYYHNLGDAYRGMEQYEEADFCYRKAIEYNATIAFSWNNRGMVLLKTGHNEEASGFFEKAISVELNCDVAKLNFDLFNSLLDAERPKHVSVEKILSIATMASNLGTSYLGQGDVERSLKYFRLSADLDPSDSGVFSNWLMGSLYLPNLDDQSINERHDEWRNRYCYTIVKPSYQNSRDPTRKLKIGYVSPDFRSHAVNSFFESFYSFHDTNVVEPILYAEVNVQDDVGRRLESKAFAWRRTFGMSDEAVFEQILRDEVDILVDLAGHTAGNRLSVFARFPAPIQITYLGYPGQTALPNEVYRIVDDVLEPRLDGQPRAGHLKYLSPCFCCFKPNYETPPVQELPASRNGYVTFGMLHGLCKLNSQVLDTWCDVLKAVPDSKLFMFRNSLTGNALARIRNEFIQRDISESRIELQSEYDIYRSHLLHYDRIDITLDTFPWSGHTTCTEALWMGVPAITLNGQRHASRMVASVLAALGCEEWIAGTKEEYVAKAVALAADLDRLAHHRRTLRPRMQASPVCDGQSFAKKIEALYRQLWIEWLAHPK